MRKTGGRDVRIGLPIRLHHPFLLEGGWEICGIANVQEKCVFWFSRGLEISGEKGGAAVGRDACGMAVSKEFYFTVFRCR